MKLIRNLDHLPDALRRGAVTIGNFDGVHLGHRKIIQRLLARARQASGPALAFTFDPPPGRILRPQHAPAPLCWIERKAQLLTELGVNAVIAYPTDRAFLELTAREFFDRFLIERLDARVVVEGPNFFFGHNRAGDVNRLREFCQQAGIAVEIVEPVEDDGQIISSSRIRREVAEGHLGAAGEMLTQPYRIRGRVVAGARRGAALGFPTANLEDVDLLLPGEGIYAARAEVAGSLWPAAVSLGPNPTFGEGQRKVEAYLLGFSGDLYGEAIELDFLARLREIVRFDSVDELVAQMNRDVAVTKAIVEQHDRRAVGQAVPDVE